MLNHVNIYFHVNTLKIKQTLLENNTIILGNNKNTRFINGKTEQVPNS